MVHTDHSEFVMGLGWALFDPGLGVQMGVKTEGLSCPQSQGRRCQAGRLTRVVQPAGEVRVMLSGLLA
jgi:hypothetical protein